jgi:hypothetical protein
LNRPLKSDDWIWPKLSNVRHSYLTITIDLPWCISLFNNYFRVVVGTLYEDDLTPNLI